MKINEILNEFKQEVAELKNKVILTKNNTERYSNEVNQLTQSVLKLVNITNSLCECVEALYKEQIGD